jgi:hypothetical protein
MLGIGEGPSAVPPAARGRQYQMRLVVPIHPLERPRRGAGVRQSTSHPLRQGKAEKTAAQRDWELDFGAAQRGCL